MNSYFYTPEQGYSFDSIPETQGPYSLYNQGEFSDICASDVNSLPQFTAPNDSMMDNSNALLMADMAFVSANRRRSAPAQTPAELLELLVRPGSELPVNDLYGSFVHANGPSLSVAPSALHSPYVSPAHSRQGSSQSQMGYSQVYNSPFVAADPQTLYNGDQFGTYSPSTHYGAHLTAPIHVVNEPLTPPMSIAPGLVYSPAISRRPSSQAPSVSTQASPAIMRVNLTSCSPSTSPFMGHARSPSTSSRQSDRDESGTSAYSPYSHRHTVSSSTGGFSPVNIPVTPHLRNGSFSTNSHRSISPVSSVATSSGMGGAFSKFSLDSRPDLLAAAKKRKRTDFFGMESSEDEYTGGVDDAEVSDEDYDEEFGSKKARSKKARRMPKKQKLVRGATITVLNADLSVNCSTNHHGSPPDSAVPPEEIKVWKLIPITKEDTSCPHCTFIPSNRRFSDLKRHHEKHLIKEAKEKSRWVCLDCGDVEEIVVEERAENGAMVTKSLREYVPKAAVSKVYTRKDSGSRHWRQDHKEKEGMLCGDNRIVQVDRIRGDGHNGRSSEEL